MRDENYYREKEKPKPARTLREIHDSKVKQHRAIGLLSEFFRFSYTRQSTPAAETTEPRHKRTPKQRRIRRAKHRARMRNAA